MADIVERLRDGMTREQVAATGIVPALWEEAADEIERLRKALNNWRDEVGKLHSQVDRLRAELAEAKAATEATVKAERERCLAICKANREAFASEEYAAGQPTSSIGERFACDEIAAAIRGDTP